MKQYFAFLIFLVLGFLANAQNQFHVFTKTHHASPGTTSGDGSRENPWDLQTALSQKPEKVNGGDTIWLHEGVYRGRFISTLKSTIANKNIVVASFKDEWAILDGNINAKDTPVLTVKGNNVTYKNFEVTGLGDLPRESSHKDFKKFSGIYHTSGKNCKFLNLIIHNNIGLGFGSWNKTGGTIISDCMVYNNGWIINGKGRGEGFYVQNNSDNKVRILKNNIIFNNYYKGIEVWSANRNAKEAYVKNITLDNNVIFNSGLPANGRTVDNIIVASDDRNSINIARNIKVINNILYHNTDFKSNQVNGDAASLTLGFYHKAPVENIVVDNNVIIGRNNALRILYAKSLKFTNNKVYSGYVTFTKSIHKHVNKSQWQFDNNSYYTKKTAAFRIPDERNYPIQEWKSIFKMDKNSSWNSIKKFDLNPVLSLIKHNSKPNTFRVVLFDKYEKDVEVDFSEYNIKSGTPYTIRDVENHKNVLVYGVVDNTTKVTFPMSYKNQIQHKTLNNFGVFVIEFDENKSSKRVGFFGRLLNKIF